MGTKWTDKCKVEHVSMIQHAPYKGECSTSAVKSSTLDAYQYQQFVQWCRTESSSDNSHYVVDWIVCEHCTATRERSNR